MSPSFFQTMHVLLSLVKMVDNVLKIQQLLIVSHVNVHLAMQAKCVIHRSLLYVCNSSSFHHFVSCFYPLQLLDAAQDVKMVVHVLVMFVYVLQVILEYFVKHEVNVNEPYLIIRIEASYNSTLLQIFVCLLVHVKMVANVHRLVLITYVIVQVQVTPVQIVLKSYHPSVSLEEKNFVFSDL